MSKGILYYAFLFVLYVLAQVLIFNNINLFHIAFVYAYVGFLLILPFEIGKVGMMFIALVTGLVIDSFENTLGIHAAACVLIAYIRPFYIGLMTPQGGYDSGTTPILRTMGKTWFLPYAMFMIFIHHSTLFFLEAATFSGFFFTLSKIISSSLFTFIVIVLIQYLFYAPRRVV